MPRADLHVCSFDIVFIYLAAFLIVFILPQIIWAYPPFCVFVFQQGIQSLLLCLFIDMQEKLNDAVSVIC